MYEEKDLQEIQAQRKRRWILLLIPVGILAVLAVIAFIRRVEWLAMAATLAGGALLIAGYDLAIKPLSAYAVHVNNMLHGRRREIELPFANFSEDLSLVDGVRYHALTCTDYDEKGKPYERLFYYDAEKPAPDFRPGEVLHIVFHDKEISVIERAGSGGTSSLFSANLDRRLS